MWFFITIKPYKEYQNSLEKTLKQTTDNTDKRLNPIIEQFNKAINSQDLFLLKLDNLKTDYLTLKTYSNNYHNLVNNYFVFLITNPDNISQNYNCKIH
jgi:hypothetical protein